MASYPTPAMTFASAVLHLELIKTEQLGGVSIPTSAVALEAGKQTWTLNIVREEEVGKTSTT